MSRNLSSSPWPYRCISRVSCTQCYLYYLLFTNFIISMLRTLSSKLHALYHQLCLQCISRVSCTGIISSISPSQTLASQHHELYRLNYTNYSYHVYHLPITNSIIATSRTLSFKFHKLYHLNSTNSIIYHKLIQSISRILLAQCHEIYHLNSTNLII